MNERLSGFSFIVEHNLEGLRHWLEENSGDANETEGENETSLLIQAAYTGQHEMVKLLLRHGADVNYVDKFHQTALHYAVFVGKPRMVGLQQILLTGEKVKILLDLGADITVTSSAGLTPVSLATRKKIVSVLSLFNQFLNVWCVSSLLTHTSESDQRRDFCPKAGREEKD